jgi:transcriptional regulator with XRE-family HTH domain
MASFSYGEVLAQNIRAARARAGIGQELLAARMRFLGFDGWVRQTVGSTEKPSRRVTAEEIFGLALALEVSMSELLAPTVLNGPSVQLPGGSLEAKSLIALATGRRTHAIKWNGAAGEVGPDTFEWWIGQHPELTPLARDLDAILRGDGED